ncbi:MAG: endonuclease/exonuclease/phosphatase family protein [Solirubrobacterales bacterium]|nr:endonuclease/exonuclease/phosphatase family protein [Solirubrobacterales bacterium]
MTTNVLRAATVAALAALAIPAAATAGDRNPHRSLRVATFNASLNRTAEGRLVADLSTPANAQAAAVAEVIQRVRPDVLLVNEFDYDAQGAAARLFADNYLSVGHNGAESIRYPYRFTAPSNTGIPTGLDLDNNGRIGGGGDAFGFGAYPGQFGMQVYSRYPIAEAAVRTFQRFRWTDMPGALLPTPFYSPEEEAVLRLSSKSHWDLPLIVDGDVVHFLVSHPTPPVFDGPEDRNGRRNFDEIRFWADYVQPGQRSAYIYDDEGARGGLQPGARFVIAGDQNSDPLDGDSVPGAIQQLLEHPRIDDTFVPGSAGAAEASALQGAINTTHRGDPRFDTADFADSAPGNLRVDYVLPSKGRLKVRGGFVFWPTLSDPLSRLTGVFPFPTSDHRLVALDLEVR